MSRAVAMMLECFDDLDFNLPREGAHVETAPAMTMSNSPKAPRTVSSKDRTGGTVVPADFVAKAARSSPKLQKT